MLGSIRLRVRRVLDLTAPRRAAHLVHGQAAAQPWAWCADEEAVTFSHYDFVRTDRIALAPGAAGLSTLLWFIPDFNIGSGGHQTIFRTIWHLERMGWVCDFLENV